VERWRELGILAEDVEILAVEVEDEASVPEGAGPWVLAVARDGIYRQPVDDPGMLACWKSFGAWRMWLARAGEALAIRVVAVSGGWVLHEAVIHRPDEGFVRLLTETVGSWGRLGSGSPPPAPTPERVAAARPVRRRGDRSGGGPAGPMRTRFDLAAALPAALASRTAAWRLLREYVADWLAPLTTDDGVPDAELDAAHTRLGRDLPAAVREAYRLCGDHAELTGSEHVLLAADELYVDETGTVLVFREEQQGAARWGVRRCDLDDPDPPVVYTLAVADAPPRWERWLDRFSTAWLELVLSESLATDDDRRDFRELDEEEGELLAERFTRLPLPEYPVSQTDAPGVRWYAGPDLLLRDDARAFVTARARTETALAQLHRLLPGDWDSLAIADWDDEDDADD
jgi:hypothetical protein